MYPGLSRDQTGRSPSPIAPFHLRMSDTSTEDGRRGLRGPAPQHKLGWSGLVWSAPRLVQLSRPSPAGTAGRGLRGWGACEWHDAARPLIRPRDNGNRANALRLPLPCPSSPANGNLASVLVRQRRTDSRGSVVSFSFSL